MLSGLRPRATAAGVRPWQRPAARPSAPSARARPVLTRTQQPQQGAIEGAGAAAGAGGGGGGDGPNCWETSIVWRLEDFRKIMPIIDSTHRSDISSSVHFSEPFEAGICTWKLQASSSFPDNSGYRRTGYLSVNVLAVDPMWQPTTEIRVTVVNHEDASKSISLVSGGTEDCSTSGHKLVRTSPGISYRNDVVMKLSDLNDPEGGWLVDEALELHCAVAIKDAPKFNLETEKVIPDLSLALPCGAKLPAYWQQMRLASDVLCRCVEDESMSVEGSLGAWTYILMWISPQHLQPTLTLGGVYTVLPVAHKYGFTTLVSQLVASVKREDLSPHPNDPIAYVINWLKMAEELELDALREVCWEALKSWDGLKVRVALIGDDTNKVVRREVCLLSQGTVCMLLELAAPYMQRFRSS